MSSSLAGNQICTLGTFAMREPLRSLFVLPILLPMPRDFITLSDMPQAVLGITCDLCQRREQLDVEALKAQHGGDVKMPELLSRLVADCPRQRERDRSASMSGVGRCMTEHPFMPRGGRPIGPSGLQAGHIRSRGSGGWRAATWEPVRASENIGWRSQRLEDRKAGSRRR